MECLAFTVAMAGVWDWEFEVIREFMAWSLGIKGKGERLAFFVASCREILNFTKESCLSHP